MNSLRWLHRFAVLAVLTTYLLIVVGGIVRVTGSGLACPDWPKCQGQWIPPLRFDVWIEYIHRLLALVVSSLVIVTAVLAWRRSKTFAREVASGKLDSVRLALLAVGLLVVQILLGAWTVVAGNRGDTVIAHLLAALLLFATLVVLAVRTSANIAMYVRRLTSRSNPPGLRRLSRALVALTLTLIAVGSGVQTTGGLFACLSFPLCMDRWWPSDIGLPAELHMLHRYLAVAVGIVLFVLAVGVFRHYVAGARRWATLALVVYGLQFVVGIAQVLLSVYPPLRVMHLALGAALWAIVVSLATHVELWSAAEAKTTSQPQSDSIGVGAQQTA